jgi:pimeloyl-ACP methyl ester carboxylesterase
VTRPMRIDLGAVALDVHVAGAGPLVVLVPGLGRAAGEFDRLTCALVDAGYRAAAIDPRGIAGSTGPAAATLYDYADDVLGVIDALGGPAHVVGYTISNRVVRCAAHRAPDAVRSLILLGAGGKRGPDPESALAGRQFMEGLRARATTDDLTLLDRARRAYLSPATHPGPDLLADWWVDQAFAQHAALVATPFDGWWDGGGRPILVIQGVDDRLAPPDNGHLLAQEAGPRVQVRDIAAAGHLVLFEQPEAVVRAVSDFLRAFPA